MAQLLRAAVIEVGQAKLSGQQRATKAAKILDYLTSAECKSRFERITDSIDVMRKMQTNERNYHDDHWRKEEQALSEIATASAGLHGQLVAIARTTPAKTIASV
jgi:hypothetical protein